jgi:hypothetical protein
LSKKKDYRKQLAGHRRALKEHLNKIEEEKNRPRPRVWLIKLWEKQVANIRKQIEKLERRLHR